MVMTLTASESGIITYTKRPGAVLDAGTVLGHLELDDPSLITRAQDYKGQFPELDVSTPTVGDKLNHKHAHYRQMLDNILAGLCCYFNSQYILPLKINPSLNY